MLSITIDNGTEKLTGRYNNIQECAQVIRTFCWGFGCKYVDCKYAVRVR